MDSGLIQARRSIERLFRGYSGPLAVRLWNGETVLSGGDTAAATLVFGRAQPLRDLILRRDPLRLAEDYVHGHVDLEGDIFTALQLKQHLESVAFSLREQGRLLVAALSLPRDRIAPSEQRAWRRWFHSWSAKTRNRRAIAFHYDVSNAFYNTWLDERMVYSCAYFEHADEPLDQAQRNKLDHICRKLRLRPGEHLLDIGCGWGGLVCWAAARYGVRAHGITLSRNQFEHAVRAVREQGLQDRVTIELRDYRELAGEASYDKVASVGMFEHVGLRRLPLYFDTVHRLLKPGGLFLNHGITHDIEGWRRTVATRFINRHVFPDGELDRVSNVQRVMEQSGFEIHDLESLRAHYALTLRHWVDRLEARRDEALRHVSDAIYRVWRLYMAACALGFEEGGIGVYQILASKRAPGTSPVPLTRRDLYAARATDPSNSPGP